MHFQIAYEPYERQDTNALHDPLVGPEDPQTLQCPSTASSGRKLTRTTCGGW
jgi:hypothetical protein